MEGRLTSHNQRTPKNLTNVTGQWFLCLPQPGGQCDRSGGDETLAAEKTWGVFIEQWVSRSIVCGYIYIYYIHNNVHSMELFLFVVLEFWTPISSRISSEKIDPNWWLGIWNWWTREILHWDFAVESWGLQKIWSGVWGTARVSFHFHDGKKIVPSKKLRGSKHPCMIYVYIHLSRKSRNGR